MNLNIISYKTACIAIATAAFFCLLGWAGHQDYVEHVYYNMPDQVYEAITLKLGDGASNSEVVREYMDNKQYWDQYDY